MNGMEIGEAAPVREGAGTLFLVATPIGNLEDMTFRAVEVLRGADLIAAEDTRVTRGLLTHFEIRARLVSYHEHNKKQKEPELIRLLLSGTNIALVTDAGMPGISDPGADLAAACYDEGIPVTIVPGACAAVSALAISALDTRRFVFEGFLPTNKKERRAVLERLAGETRTCVLYEAPHRLAKTLEEMARALGDRRVTVVKELTKRHEKRRRMTLPEAAAYYAANEARGEYVLVLEGKDPQELAGEAQEAWTAMSVADHVRMYEEQGLDRKEAMRRAAGDRGVSRREIYAQLLGAEESTKQ